MFVCVLQIAVFTVSMQMYVHGIGIRLDTRLDTMERMRVALGTPLPGPVKALLNRPAPAKTARVETFTGEVPDDATTVVRKRFTLEDTASLTIRSNSRYVMCTVDRLYFE